MKIVEIPIKDLKPAEYNPRAATEKEMNDLKESLKRFGFVDPNIVNSAPKRKNVIIGGHMRTRAWEEMGHKTAPCVMVNIPDLKKEQELNLRLNKNTGHWNFDMLANFDDEMLQEVGWDSSELDSIFQLADKEDPFNLEEELASIKKPISKVGDVYQLGNHRLMCGNSTKKEDVETLMGGIKADMVFSDPPYNVNYQSEKLGKIKNDSMGEEPFVDFSLAFMENINDSLKKGGVYYICSGYASYPTFLYAIKKNGMKFSAPIIWVKNYKSFKSFADYKTKQEMILKGRTDKKKKSAIPIMYGWKEGPHYFVDDPQEADVWEIKCRVASTMIHPTQKPIELIGRAIRNSSKRGEIVLDLFGGSGSTLIAAEQEGRRAFLMELDPKFVDITIKRWEAFTSQKAQKQAKKA